MMLIIQCRPVGTDWVSVRAGSLAQPLCVLKSTRLQSQVNKQHSHLEVRRQLGALAQALTA